jgi:rhodanese-related sulfurtransferase
MTEHQILEPEDFKVQMANVQNKIVLDCRSLDEFKSGTIPEACCIPVDDLANQLNILNKESQIFVFCGSGKRSAKACAILKANSMNNICELSGGFNNWQAQNNPVLKKRQAISLQRQVMIAAGFLVLLGAVLGHFVNYRFFLLSVFVGLGLSFAGISGFCGMALLLEKMPWNKAVS